MQVVVYTVVISHNNYIQERNNLLKECCVVWLQCVSYRPVSLVYTSCTVRPVWVCGDDDEVTPGSLASDEFWCEMLVLEMSVEREG